MCDRNVNIVVVVFSHNVLVYNMESDEFERELVGHAGYISGMRLHWFGMDRSTEEVRSKANVISYLLVLLLYNIASSLLTASLLFKTLLFYICLLFFIYLFSHNIFYLLITSSRVASVVSVFLYQLHGWAVPLYFLLFLLQFSNLLCTKL